jgi:hypothetical protein
MGPMDGPTDGCSGNQTDRDQRHRHGVKRTIRYQHRHARSVRCWHVANTRIRAPGGDLREPRHRMPNVGRHIRRRAGRQNWHSPPWSAGYNRLCPRGDMSGALGRAGRIHRNSARRGFFAGPGMASTHGDQPVVNRTVPLGCREKHAHPNRSEPASRLLGINHGECSSSGCLLAVKQARCPILPRTAARNGSCCAQKTWVQRNTR